MTHPHQTTTAYGTIEVVLRCKKADLYDRESALFNEFSHITNDLEEWLRRRTHGTLFTFIVNEK
jgi:hypothetical protein